MFDFTTLRAQFPSLAREGVIYLDGPAGSQVPQSVIQAISDYYVHHNANRAGQFASSFETDQLMQEAHRAAADWFGASDPHETVFGANMTTLTFQLSRALSRDWTASDTIVVTQLDHDANVSPWRLAAQDRGAQVRTVRINVADATLDMSDFQQALALRPKLVAVTAASNSVGTLTPLRQLIDLAHRAGAEVYVDAVHYAPHMVIDVAQWQADFVVCSAYKFFGPHVGLLWARSERLRELQAYKVTPAPDAGPGKWMTGTQNHAAICGVTAAINYVSDIGRAVTAQPELARRPALAAAMEAIEAYERQLFTPLLEGLLKLPKVKVFGCTDLSRLDQRLPTVAMAIEGIPSSEAARRLAQHGIFCWHGHYYAIAICDALGQSPQGMVRMGLMHINTAQEVQRTLEVLRTEF